jgi:two-component system chemotaxis sensor kinase CheA
MPRRNGEFLKKLLATFRVEADEHLKAMSSGLIELEKASAGEQRPAIVERIFREAHSLKGAARAVNLGEVESVCQSLESVFAALKGETLATSPPLFDLLHQAVDALGGLLAADSVAPAAAQPAISSLVQRLDKAAKARAPQAREAARPPPDAMPAPAFASETVRVATLKLDAVMHQVEELLYPRLAAAERVKELGNAAALLTVRRKERLRIEPTLRIAGRALEGGKANGAVPTQEFAALVEYLDAENLFLKTLEKRVVELTHAAERDQRALAGMADGLLHDVKAMHMLPFTSLIEIFPRHARELARAQGKEVELVIRGGEIEIDRRILEEMKDPLMHLLRNCIDHGIEKPAVRAEKGKPPQGTITLTVSQTESSKVEVLVTDDGAGIDAAAVKAAARKLGLLSVEGAEKLGEPEAPALVFRSGVSTSPIITDVSGRGLGLAIVREKVERLSGTIALESRPGAGTSFRIALPLTLATFRGVLVRAGGQIFMVPAISIERAARVAEADIRTVENRETIPLDGQAVALVRLSDVLEMSRKASANDSVAHAQALVLGAGPARIAFRVEQVLGEQEVLVKPLGPQLARVRNVAGACVLGTGRVVPVLNVFDLMKSAVNSSATPRAAATEPPEQAEQRSVLVVEDSITARALLRNILESAGYRVATAVDGADAYVTLKTGAFDLVVSDVEMPRMDGFDLTAKIRADKRLAELPVVLVTALESREHRERGIEAGANAYIVKSSFDQSNLLEIVRRLV